MRPHILIVDDDPDIRESLGDMLSHEGYIVESAASGTEALQQAKQTQYGAALLDIHLPDLSGLSVLKVMMELDPSLPVIILTGNATPENTIGSLAKGAFAYLTKPYNSQELKAVLRRAVAVKGLAVRAEYVEQALHASEERFRALVESATDGIVLADQNGHIIWWNGAAERMFGYNKQEALGHPLTMLMPERFRSAHTAGISRLVQGTATTFIGKTTELVGLTKAGEEFPIELSLASWHAKEGIFFSGIVRNIARRKRAEEAVARLSHQNRLILDGAGEGIFGLDLQGCATFVNATAARMLGWGPEELLGKPMAPLLYQAASGPSVMPPDPFSLQAALRDGAIHRIQNETFFKKDGTSLPAHYVTSPIHEQDRTVGAVVVFQDGTERARQERLQQAQLSVSHILAQADHIEEAILPILRVTAEMGPWDLALWWQPPSADANLVCRGDWLRPGRHWQDFVTLCRNSAMPPGLDFPGITKTSKLPLWVPDAMVDGRFTRRPTAARLGIHTACAVPIRTGNLIQGVLELFSDSTLPPSTGLLQALTDTGMKVGQFIERTCAIQALRSSHEMTQGLLASLPGAILLCDRTQRIRYTNPLAAQYFGEGRSLIGRLLSDCLALPETAIRYLNNAASPPLAETGPRPPEGECELAGRTYRYRFFPVAAAESGEHHTGIMLWDITEDKQLQDQLIQTEKLSGLGTMVSGMAHEINNPAQAILSMAELIQDEEDPRRIKEFAADIVGYARHVSTVVRDFVSYARATGRDGETALDLAERLVEALKMVRRGPHFERLEVVTQFDVPAFLRARKGEIDQVFVNLISNAAQAMRGNGRLVLTTNQEGPWVTVTVADNGPGIPPSILPHIFDPFFTTKEAGQGTGLGLSVVRKIVAKYDGTVTVESLVGHGTTFQLRFPSAAL